MIACFLSNISAKYYKNPSMLSQVMAKNVGMFFFETLCISKMKTRNSVDNDNEVDTEKLKVPYQRTAVAKTKPARMNIN